jgi:hypothetical protein
MNTTDPASVPAPAPASVPAPEPEPEAKPNLDSKNGGRHHKSHKGGKTKKVNSALKSWVAFVKKISKEENISYPKAMKRASKRKSEWKRGGGEMEEEQEQEQSGGEQRLTPSEISASQNNSANIVGGSRKRRGSMKRSGSRKRRSSRRR